MAKRVKPKKKIAINPTTGKLDVITDNNFSYESVPLGKKLEIPENMQMIYFGDFFELDGEIRIDGSMILED
jgi:hypothetical protein